MPTLGDIGNHGETQKSHNADYSEDTHIGKIQEYKDTRIRIYRRYEDDGYRPFPPSSPSSRVEGRGGFDSGVFDRHLWSLCVSGHSHPGWYR